MNRYAIKSFFTFIIVTTSVCFLSAFKRIQPRATTLPQFITDKLGLTSIRVNKIIAPTSVEELQSIVRTTTLPVSITGACYSQGGQTGYPDGLVIDMKNLNQIVSFDEKQKTITAQAGATWYDVQKYIDPYNLSVKAMQSYNNFSIGGSLSINAHGRDIAYGSVINGIQSIQILLANGELITADRANNSNLFKAAIGGYGLLGIIIQATIELTENVPLERKVYQCDVSNFNDLFFNTIAKDKSVVFYNTNLFPKQYEQCLTTTWHTTAQTVTNPIRLQEQNSPFYMVNKALEMFIRRVPLAKHSRRIIEPSKKIGAPQLVVWRNNEMSYSVNQLAIDWHFPTTMTLQEYFVPIEQAQHFAKKLSSILRKNWVNVLNISIRYVPADTTSTMSYAKQDSFAFVLYLNLFNIRWSINRSCTWTQKIIDAALECNGSYYLPYLMCATQEQFNHAYPQFDELLKTKKTYDPDNKFRNILFKKYLEH